MVSRKSGQDKSIKGGAGSLNRTVLRSTLILNKLCNIQIGLSYSQENYRH